MTSHSPKLSLLGLAICFLALALAAYCNSFKNTFAMDDNAFFVYAPQNASLSSFQLDIFQSPQTAAPQAYVYFRPLSHALLWLEAGILGQNILFLHLFNFLLFYFCSLVLFDTVHFLFKNLTVAVLTTLFFISHPVNGELVCYLTACVYSFLIICILMALRMYVSGLEQQNIFLQATGLTAFACALLCHESAMMFPLYLCSTLYFVYRWPAWSILRKTVPVWIMAAMYCIFRLNFASLWTSMSVSVSQFHMSLTHYLFAVLSLINAYFANIFLLKDIVLVRSISWADHGHWPWECLMMVLLAAWIYILFKSWKDNIKCMALSWIVLGLCPLALGSVSRPNLGIMMETHWFLMTSIGFFIFLASCFNNLKISLNDNKLWFVLVLGILMVFTLSCRQYNKDIWGNEENHARQMLRLNPQMPLVHYWLGCLYIRENRLDEASIQFQQAFDGTWGDWRVFLNLGFIEFEKKRYTQALEYYSKALTINPNSQKVRQNIELIKKRRG